jgi:hypothetical protein
MSQQAIALPSIDPGMPRRSLDPGARIGHVHLKVTTTSARSPSALFYVAELDRTRAALSFQAADRGAC